MATGQNAGKSLHAHVKGMLIALSVQYAAGMTINLFSGDGPEKRMLVGAIALYAHMLIAILLLTGSIVILVFVKKSGVSRWINFVYHGFYSILFAFGAGIARELFPGNMMDPQQ